MSKIYREKFIQSMADTAIDTETLQQTEAFEGVDVSSADRNKDGKISGSRELKKLFKKMDFFDRDGDSESMDLIAGSRQSEMVSAIKEVVESSEIEETTDGPYTVVLEETYTKDEFLQDMDGKALEVSVLRAQMPVSGNRLKRMDLDGDGLVTGKKEMERLWKEIDRPDDNGDGGSITRMRDAKETRAGELAAIAKTNAIDYDPSAEWRQNIVDAATDLIEKYSEHYAVNNSWFNIDPNHAIRTGDTGHTVRGRWKCNLFLGNVLHHAGMETPFYGDRGTGNYPNANQVHKWSDAYHRRYGTDEKFQMRDELDLTSDEFHGMSQEQKVEAVRDVLASAQPGDLILVDHMGDEVSDGGHCRVVIENNIASGGTIRNAQAAFDGAEIQDELIKEFLKEEKIWILRANQPREDFEAGSLIGQTE